MSKLKKSISSLNEANFLITNFQIQIIVSIKTEMLKWNKMKWNDNQFEQQINYLAKTRKNLIEK